MMIIKKIFKLLTLKINDIRLFYEMLVFTNIDSITQYDKFTYRCNKFFKSNIVPTFSFGGETILYGHYDALICYAGLKGNKWKRGLNIEHGVRFYDLSIPRRFKDYYYSFIFQSKRRFSYVDMIDNMALKYEVGPYIYYAKRSINDIEFNKLKKKLGKTLLIVPTHSFEYGNIARDEEDYYNVLIKENCDKYDTLLVCVYWHDVNDHVLKRFKENHKVKLVSAGMRFDRKFINRLRTIYDLADEVIGNSLGTYIGYALSLKKNLRICDIKENISIYDNKYTKEQNEIFINSKNEIISSINNHDNIDYIFSKYFGGKNALKSSDELKNIFLDSYKNYLNNKYRRYRYYINKLRGK